MKKKNAFTLIELIVGIIIIILITLAIIKVNFNSIANSQKIEIFANKIISEIERVRNNSLVGKGVGNNLVIPDRWKIELMINGSGSMTTSYESGSIWVEDNELIIADFYEIDNINCTNDLSSSEIGTIIFEKGYTSLDDNCYSDQKITIDLSYAKSTTKTIEFNAISGLIKE